MGKLPEVEGLVRRVGDDVDEVFHSRGRPAAWLEFHDGAELVGELVGEGVGQVIEDGDALDLDAVRG